MPRDLLADMPARKTNRDGTSAPRDLLAGKVAPEPVAGQASDAPQDTGAGMAHLQSLKSGILSGMDDEIGAALTAPVNAAVDWVKGEGFDIGRAYNRTRDQLDAEKAMRREVHPVASATGEIVGGLGLGAGAAKAGLTLAGKAMSSVPRIAGAGAVEGAAYGGLYGAGDAQPGERLEGARDGAALGLAAGGVLGAAGGAIALRSARNAANAAAPTADDLAIASRRLYEAAENEGVRYGAQATDVLRNELRTAAGRINDRLRPKTAGFMDDIDNVFSGDVSLEAFDEFRKGLNAEMRRASPDDARTLGAMKRAADQWSEKVQNIPHAFTGNAQKATGLLGEARKMWGQHRKADVIEKILDKADVDGQGRYSQSGFANATRREMNSLYKRIQKGKEKGWTKEEISLIRQMASGGSASRIVNLMAKFDPRGVVSIIGGQAAGSAIPGVGNVAVPLAGHVAGRSADRAAFQAANTLRDAAAAGVSPNMLAIPQARNALTPFIPAGAAGTNELLRRLEGAR